MDPRIQKELSQEIISPFHAAMLTKVKSLVDPSRRKMAQYHGDWDRYDEVYRGVKNPDKADVKARERKEPEKMVIPMTFAQCQVFAAFCFQLFFQKPTFFELSGTGIEDAKAAKIAEATLQRDLNYNQWVVKVYQLLLDIARFGFGVVKHTWVRETQMQWVKGQVPPPTQSMQGIPFQPTEAPMELKECVKFLGNRLYSISPYRFYPDTNVPLNEFQNGEFCASEEDVTRIWMRKQEKNGLFAGTKHIKEMTTTEWDSRKKFTRTGVQLTEKGTMTGVLYTEVQLDIIPNEFKLVDGKPLGPEDYPVKYVVCYANDSRIVKCEPLGYLHGNFTYSLAQLSPDQHRSVNAGISELIDQLQDVVTWLFNSRITSVRKTIQNQLIVDPAGVEMADLTNRNPVIRLKKGVSSSGVDRWIKQLQVTDVTQNHLRDAESLGQLIQVVTGINENALGQYSKGRRSAEQTKAVNSGAASRLKMQASLIHCQLFEPLGRDMLSNLRDGLDEEQLVRILGLQTVMPQSPNAVQAQNFTNFLGITKEALIGNYDFEMLDLTLGSEKGFMAQGMQEILMVILGNPEAAITLGFDPQALMQEIAELRGIKNPERFQLQPAKQQMMMQMAQQAQMAGQPQVAAQVAAPAQVMAGQNAIAPAPQIPDLSQLMPAPTVA